MSVSFAGALVECLLTILDSMIVVVVYCLAIAHPGPVFKGTPSALAREDQFNEPKIGGV